MGETVKEKWEEFREDFGKTKERDREAAGSRLTRYEKDYGPEGKYRLKEPKIDESAGSECLDD